MNLVETAKEFAESQHCGQYRKHGQRPYIYHPEQVYLYLLGKGYMDTDLLASAWLHDVVEDCNVTHEEIERWFGGRVSRFVREVSEPELLVKYNRAERWNIYLQHYANASLLGKVLKLADRCCNLQEYADFWDEVPRSDRKFLDNVYLLETDELLDEIGDASREIARDICKVINKLDLLLMEDDA